MAGSATFNDRFRGVQDPVHATFSLVWSYLKRTWLYVYFCVSFRLSCIAVQREVAPKNSVSWQSGGISQSPRACDGMPPGRRVFLTSRYERNPTHTFDERHQPGTTISWRTPT